MKLRVWFDKHFHVLEPAGSATLGVVAWWGSRQCGVEVAAVLSGDRTTLYGPLASIFGALLGFVIAAFSVIVTLMPNQRLDFIRKRGLDEGIWRAFMLASLWCAVATAVPVVGLVLDRNGNPSPAFLGVLFGSTVLASLSVFRCVRLLAAVGRAVRARPDAD